MPTGVCWLLAASAARGLLISRNDSSAHEHADGSLGTSSITEGERHATGLKRGRGKRGCASLVLAARAQLAKFGGGQASNRWPPATLAPAGHFVLSDGRFRRSPLIGSFHPAPFICSLIQATCCRWRKGIQPKFDRMIELGGCLELGCQVVDICSSGRAEPSGAGQGHLFGAATCAGSH